MGILVLPSPTVEMGFLRIVGQFGKRMATHTSDITGTLAYPLQQQAEIDASPSGIEPDGIVVTRYRTAYIAAVIGRGNFPVAVQIDIFNITRLHLGAILLDDGCSRFGSIGVGSRVVVEIVDRIETIGLIAPESVDRIAHGTYLVAAEIVGRVAHTHHFVLHVGERKIHSIGEVFTYLVLPRQGYFPTFVLHLAGILVGLAHTQYIGEFHLQQNIIGILDKVVGRQRQAVVKQVGIQTDVSHSYRLPRQYIVRCLTLLHR